MKRSFLLCLSAVFLISGPVSAQIKDSLGNECLIPAAESSFSQYVDRRTSTKGYRMTFVAVPLILGGAVVSLYDIPTSAVCATVTSGRSTTITTITCNMRPQPCWSG